MKTLLFAAVLLCAPLTLTACATTPTSTPHLNQGRAISAAWSSLKFAEDSADALAIAGSLKGADAARASADIKLAHQVLTSADAVYRASGSTADVSAQIAQAAALAAEILTIVSAHK